MRRRKLMQHVLLGVTATLAAVGARFAPADAEPGPVLAAAAAVARGETATPDLATAVRTRVAARGIARLEAASALAALGDEVRATSHPRALEDAFRSYFAFRARHPERVRKPYLYFVDYGLPSTTPRGWVFDMERKRVVEGPFMVAHGRGSAPAGETIPRRFSNTSGAATTSLGLYVAQELYHFRGKASGQQYESIGLRLAGVSRGFNDNARARGVVAHGAPYVTATRAGRSEGCPAVEEERAQRLLPKLSGGALVFLFAPERGWMARDPWVTAEG